MATSHTYLLSQRDRCLGEHGEAPAVAAALRALWQRLASEKKLAERVDLEARVVADRREPARARGHDGLRDRVRRVVFAGLVELHRRDVAQRHRVKPGQEGPQLDEFTGVCAGD